MIRGGVVIEDNVVTDYTGNAETLVIPEGVTEIEGSVFMHDSNLKAITLPSTLETIGTYAFYGSALTSITIPASVTSIGEEAFSRCKDLTSAVIQGTVVGSHMFYMSGVQSADLSNVRTVGDSAFADCSNLTTLNMPVVEKIGQSAFQSTKLTEFTLPNTVVSTGPSILYGADLTRLTVSLSTLLSEGFDPSTFANAFYNVSPYENNTQIILTDVNQDVTLLNNSMKAGDKTIEFKGSSSQAFLVTDVKATDGTITNQTGFEIKVNDRSLKTGGAMPADSVSDAYLYQLSLVHITDDGEEAILLEPSFGNLTTSYAASVDHTVDAVTLTAVPQNGSAVVAVVVDEEVATLDKDGRTEIALDSGTNVISISITSPNGKISKTYTLTVTRNAPAPERLQISTADGLKAFADEINRGTYGDTSGMTVELTADIALDDSSWTPIGNEGKYYFEGLFEGNGHTISNLMLDVQSGRYLGLFGASAHTTIRNVHVTGVFCNNEDAKSGYIGGIVGLAQHCEITGCTAKITAACASGKTMGMVVGGIVGEADYCHIVNCESDATLSGKAYGFWGGIAGATVGTELVNCVNRGSIVASDGTSYVLVGGIVGTAQSGSRVSQCRNLGVVSHLSGSGTAGGICGQSIASEVSECTNVGSVSSKTTGAAGIVGQVTTSEKHTSPGKVRSCLNYGTISSEAQSYAAGIVASVSAGTGRSAIIEACVSLGTVSGAKNVHAIGGYVSGSVVFEHNYYDDAILASGTIPDAVTSGSTGKGKDALHTQTFVDEVNSYGGSYRLKDGGLEIRPLTYALVIEGSHANVSGAGEYEAGAKIEIDAGTRSGYRFSGWSASSGTLSDPSSAKTTFTMPSEDVTLIAAWTPVGGGGVVFYPITVRKTDGGTVEVSPTRAVKGSIVTIAVAPDAGYKMDALVVTNEEGGSLELTDKGGGTYSFTMPASGVTVAVEFGCDGGELCPSHAFTDVDQGEWYHDAIDWAVLKGVLRGETGSYKLRPADATTRAEVVALMARVAGADGLGGAALLSFPDTPSGSWYSGVLDWAVGNGLVCGYANGNFGPDDNLTREQLAAFLQRLASFLGNDTEAGGDLSTFPDANEATFGSDALSWAVGEGIICGNQDGTLDPTGTASRAQVAAMLQRFCNRYDLL